MDRRGFLAGLFGGVTAAGIVVAASPSEIEAFAAPLVRDAPVVIDVAAASSPAPLVGEHLYNARGELVAMVTAIDITRDRIEVHDYCGAGNRIFVPGLLSVEIRAVALGEVEWESHTLRLRGLRGRR